MCNATRTRMSWTLAHAQGTQESVARLLFYMQHALLKQCSAGVPFS